MHKSVKEIPITWSSAGLVSSSITPSNWHVTFKQKYEIMNLYYFLHDTWGTRKNLKMLKEKEKEFQLF